MVKNEASPPIPDKYQPLFVQKFIKAPLTTFSPFLRLLRYLWIQSLAPFQQSICMIYFIGTNNTSQPISTYPDYPDSESFDDSLDIESLDRFWLWTTFGQKMKASWNALDLRLPLIMHIISQNPFS